MKNSDEVDAGWGDILEEVTSEGICRLLQNDGAECLLWWERGKDVGMTEQDYLRMFSELGATKEEIYARAKEHFQNCNSCAAAYDEIKTDYDRLEESIRRSSIPNP